MKHVVLLGDARFGKVAGNVWAAAMKPFCGEGDSATQLAIEGSFVLETVHQLHLLPRGASHAFIMAGVSECLSAKYYFRGSFALEQTREPSLRPPRGGAALVMYRARNTLQTVSSMMGMLGRFQDEFEASYARMVAAVRGRGLATALCTIPACGTGLSSTDQVLLSAYNDVIVRTAVRFCLPVLDLRAVCVEKDDFAGDWSDGLSEQGLARAAQAMDRLLKRHRFDDGHTCVYRADVWQSA